MRRRLIVALGVMLTLAACDNKSGPPPPPPPVLEVKAIVIHGRSRIAPGENEAFEAIAQFTDNTTQVYTTKVQWRTSDSSVISIVGNSGVATARTTGETSVAAVYGRFVGTSNVIVVPTGTYRLTGKVLESSLPVSGAVVKVVSGQGTGLSTTTGDFGDYRLYGVAGPIQFEVTKNGYTTATRSIDVRTDELLDVGDLAQTGALPSLSGTYTLTLTLVEDCRLFPQGTQFPDEAKRRSYTAVVTQDGPRLLVTLSGANFLIQSGLGNHFEGRVEPAGLSFSLGGGGPYLDYYLAYGFSLPNLAEQLSATKVLMFLGTASVSQSSLGLSGDLNGAAVIVNPLDPNGPTFRQMWCASSHHQFSLVPQTAATRHRR